MSVIAALKSVARHLRCHCHQVSDQLAELKGIIMTNAERLEASYAGIKSDIDGLGDAVTALREQVADLSENAEADKAAAVEAAVAAVEEKYDAIADKFEALDAQNPAPEPTQPTEPTEPEPAPVPDETV